VEEETPSALYTELAVYRELLLLHDLENISLDARNDFMDSAPSLSGPAQTALMISFVGLAMKVTGKKPASVPSMVPGGRVLGQSRAQRVVYLAMVLRIVDAMDKGHKWEEHEEMANLRKMQADIIAIKSAF